VSAPLETPLVHYGIGLSSAVVLAVVAFAFLDGTIRWLVLGLAVVEALVVPQFLKRAT
jgi:hypothetical protein